jgi:hypothetical protein
MTTTSLDALLRKITAVATTNAMLAQCERCAVHLLVSDSLLARLVSQKQRDGICREVPWPELCSVPRLKQLYGIGLSVLKEVMQHRHDDRRWVALLEQGDLQSYTVLQKPCEEHDRLRLFFTTTRNESYHCEILRDRQTAQVFYTMVSARDD